MKRLMFILLLAIAAVAGAESDWNDQKWSEAVVAADNDLQASYHEVRSELEKLAEKTPMEYRDFSMDLNIGRLDAESKSATSCTASATASIPGFAEVTFTATAPTCIQAGNMVIAAVSDFVASVMDAVP